MGQPYLLSKRPPPFRGTMPWAWLGLVALGIAGVEAAGVAGAALGVWEVLVGLSIEAVGPAAALLALVAWAEGRARARGVDPWARARWVHAPVAALLGLVPGCGGALAVTMAWSSGRVSFGTWVAALVATMGDAALPVAAVDTGAFAAIAAVQVVLAVPTAWALDALGWDPARPSLPATGCLSGEGQGRLADRALWWGWVVVGALAIAGLVGVPWPWGVVEFLAACAVAATLARVGMGRGVVWGDDEDAGRIQAVALWIWGVGIATAVALSWGGPGLASDLWGGVGGLALALLVGAIPGCAPILAAGAGYAQGAVPLAALGAMAVMTDGDATAPVWWRAPRAWLLATAAGAPPAVLAWWWLA